MNTSRTTSKKRKKALLRISLLLSLLLLFAGIYPAYLYYLNWVRVNINTNGQTTYLFIPPNASAEETLNLIEELKVVEDMESLRWLADKKNYKGRNIVPGKYKIKEGSNNQFINHLRAGNGRLSIAITFNQLRDIKQLSGAISKELYLDSSEVYQWLNNKDSIGQFNFNKSSIISMFIPNTYQVNWDVSVSKLMRRFHKEYLRFWNDERSLLLEKTGLSRTEAVTLASIVYWETKIPKDMRTIAGVYMNRIRIGMPLQADPTLIFAVGDYSIRRVLDVHKEINSPYNTYKFKGIPPGPIIIPPISYVDAVLNYERNNYLYFVAKEDLSGESYFSRTYNQHLIYARRYQKALNKQRVFR